MELADLARLVKTTLEELYVQSFTQPTRLLAYKLIIAVIKWLSHTKNEAIVDEVIKMLGSAENLILQIVRMVGKNKQEISLIFVEHTWKWIYRLNNEWATKNL